jgi:hypothetical protein
MDCPTNVNPPECCASPVSREVWEERGRRIEAARTAALDAQPKVCPRCGGDTITPVFPGPEWECWDCPMVWEP